MATTRQTELEVPDDSHNHAPLWTYGSAAAKRVEEQNTCKHGSDHCDGPDAIEEDEDGELTLHGIICPDCALEKLTGSAWSGRDE